MLRIIFILVLSGIFYLNTSAQTLPISTNTQAVFDKVANVFSSGKTPPELQIINNLGTVALYQPGINPIIQLDSKLLDICATFQIDSLNALASVLGHELSHYYLHNDWYSSFANKVDSDKLKLNLTKRFSEKSFEYEAQADYYGCLNAFIAGYEVLPIMPQLVDRIYDAYNLSDEINGYPSKELRKESVKQISAELRILTDIYQSSEVLIALEDFENAIICLDRVSKKFPSKTVFNNMGVCKLEQYLKHFGNDIPFVLPIEYDALGRLIYGTNRNSNLFTKEDGKKWINDAINFFEKALKIDNSCEATKINLAIAQILNQNYYASLGELKNTTHKKTSFLEAVNQYYLDTKINLDFECEDDFCKLNKRILQGEDKDEIWETYFVNQLSAYPLLKSFEIEIIGDVSLGNADCNSLPQTISTNPKLEICVSENVIQIIADDKTINFSVTEEHPKQSTELGITSRSSKTEVLKSYGYPNHQINTNRGEILHIEEGKILFYLDDGGVYKWIVYE